MPVWSVTSRRHKLAVVAMETKFRRLTMKKIFLLAAVGWLLSGCAEEQVASSHPDNWLDSDSDNSHIAKITDNGIDGCTSCHGDSYHGGTSGVSCYSCHEGGQSGHPAWAYWMGDTTSTQFHGNVAGSFQNNYCSACHGSGAPVGDSGHYCSNCH